MSDRLLQSTGRTIYTMYSQLAGALTNIIFDPFINFELDFSWIRIYGAAIATVLGQAVSLSISLYFNFKKNPDIKISIKDFRPSGKIIAIYKVGIPSILLSSISSVTTYLINLILGAFSTTAIAVYGAYFKLNSFIFMPVFGLNNGIVPIIAYNYGAKTKSALLKL